MSNKLTLASFLGRTANLDEQPATLIYSLLMEIASKKKAGELTDQQEIQCNVIISEFEKEFTNGSFSQQIGATFWLGVNYGAISGEVPTQVRLELELFRLKEEIRTAPLQEQNHRRQSAKELAQMMASMFWENDKDQKIRLGEMCDYVWGEYLSQIHKNVKILKIDKQYLCDGLPDNAAGLKPWLRDVAPDYARKAGRPPKK